MDEPYRRVDACRSCHSARLTTVLDLGTPYISDFLDPGEEGIRAPIEVVRCAACALVQTRHTVSRDVLFRDYHYLSGTNETMVAALRDVVQEAQRHVNVRPNDAVLDIGSNDGTLLRQWPHTVMRYGVEPSDLWHQGLDAGPIQHGFFPDVDLAHAGPFKVITSIAMFYAQDDPHAFVAAVRRALARDGIWVVQLQDAASVLRDRAFDYFCHEHVALYSLHSFERLIHEHGLEIRDWSANEVNGGSLRIVVGHGSKLSASVGSEDVPQAWADFASAIDGLKAGTLELLQRLKAMGKLVGGLAASTKANTLLQFYGIDSTILPWIAERQAVKWGKRTVGSNIPIVSEEWARGQHPDYLIALAWHFLESFKLREAAFLDGGGVLITLLPELAIHSKAVGPKAPIHAAA